jgi:hypothetical protein
MVAAILIGRIATNEIADTKLPIDGRRGGREMMSDQAKHGNGVKLWSGTGA